MRDEELNRVVEIWKHIVDVQQHFNDISMRIRSIFVTLVLALFASIGFLLDKKLNVELLGFYVEFYTFVPVFGILGCVLFYFMDRYWYHRLLVGAVKHAITIEKKYKLELPELSLSDAIGQESPYNPPSVVRFFAKFLVRESKFRETGKLHSDGKIELFYKSVMVVLFLTAVLLCALGGVKAHMTPAVAMNADQSNAAVSTTVPDEISTLDGATKSPLSPALPARAQESVDTPGIGSDDQQSPDIPPQKSPVDSGETN
jgi:hypothetical protein